MILGLRTYMCLCFFFPTILTCQIYFSKDSCEYFINQDRFDLLEKYLKENENSSAELAHYYLYKSFVAKNSRKKEDQLKALLQGVELLLSLIHI